MIIVNVSLKDLLPRTDVLLPVHPEKHPKAQCYLHQAGGRGAKADLKQCGTRDAAHQPYNGDSHTKGTNQALQHDKQHFLTSIEVTDEAKQEGGQQAVNGVGL